MLSFCFLSAFVFKVIGNHLLELPDLSQNLPLNLFIPSTYALLLARRRTDVVSNGHFIGGGRFCLSTLVFCLATHYLFGVETIGIADDARGSFGGPI